MPSIADTLTRKMRLPPTVQPPAKLQFDYEPLAGQLYPGAQNPTDTQLLAPPYQPPERRAADQAHMQRFDEVADRIKTIPQRWGGGAIDAAKGSLENFSQIGAEAFNQRPMSSPQEMTSRANKAVMDLMGLGAATGGRQVLQHDPNVVHALIGRHADHPAVGQDKLLKALKLEYKGASPRDIEDEAGLFRGPEGHWRHELSDEGVKINTPGLGDTEDAVLKDVYQHPELLDAWKNLRDTKVEFRPMGRDANTVGMYQNQGKFDPEVIRINSDYDIPTQRSTIIHEAAHPVQAREGFARGADKTYNPSDAIHHKLMRMELVDALRQGLDPVNNPALMQTLQQRVANLAYRYSAGESEANTIMDRFLKGDYERFKTRFNEEPRMADPSILQINAPPRTIIRPPIAESQKAFYDMFRNPTRKAGTLKLP